MSHAPVVALNTLTTDREKPTMTLSPLARVSSTVLMQVSAASNSYWFAIAGSGENFSYPSRLTSWSLSLRQLVFWA